MPLPGALFMELKMKFQQKWYKVVAIFTVIMVVLTACGVDQTPSAATGEDDGTRLPDSESEPAIETPGPERPPEPPVWILSLPVTPEELATACGPYEVASTSLAPARNADDCANLFRHGLRPKRLKEFAQQGINIAGLFAAMASGEAAFDYMGQSGYDQDMLGVLVSWTGYKIFIVFGGSNTPTLFPLPFVKKGETMLQALVRVTKNFPKPIDVASTTSALKNLAGCVSRKLQGEGETAVEGQPQAEAAPAPVPVPEGTPTSESVPEGVEVDATSSFASADQGLLDLSPEEINTLIAIGVVVIVVVVVVVVAIGGTAALPVIALAAA